MLQYLYTKKNPLKTSIPNQNEINGQRILKPTNIRCIYKLNRFDMSILFCLNGKVHIIKWMWKYENSCRILRIKRFDVQIIKGFNICARIKMLCGTIPISATQHDSPDHVHIIYIICVIYYMVWNSFSVGWPENWPCYSMCRMKSAKTALFNINIVETCEWAPYSANASIFYLYCICFKLRSMQQNYIDARTYQSGGDGG